MTLLTLDFSAVKATRAHTLAIRNLPTGSLTNHKFSSSTYLRTTLLKNFLHQNNNLLFTFVESGPREHAEPCLALVIPRYCRRRSCSETDRPSQWDGEDILSQSDMTSARSAIEPYPRRYELCQILWSIPIARNMVRPRRTQRQRPSLCTGTVLKVIRVVHNFYGATSENVQLICDSERMELDLQMQYFATRKQTQITDFFNTCQ